MEKQTPWQSSLDLTLAEQVSQMIDVLDAVGITLSVGEMWMQKKSGVSYSASQALVALSSWHKRATGVLSQLQYWMESNGYATTLTTQQVLMTWSGGSVMLLELIEATFLCLFYEDLLEAVAPHLVSELADAYGI